MNAVHLSLILLICDFHVIDSNVINNVERSEVTRVQPNILMAHAIIRHGDRNVYSTCPSDPWKDPKYWPEGFGQLTNIGKLQAFGLGEWLAKRYQPLVPNGYSVETVRVYSTETDRTLMSAGACLAGLFPPTEQQIWNPNLLWQPIPVDTKNPNLMNNCTLREKLYEEYMNSEEVQQFLQSYRNTLDNVTANCGKSSTVLMVFDSLKIESIKNKTIPAWASEVYDDLEKLSLFSFESFSATPQLARLTAGFLIKEIFNDFNNKAEGNEKKNFILYSGHDVTIVNVLNSLGIFDNDHPPYSACVVFELYEKDDEFYVQIVYKKGDDFKLLSIPDCGTKCPLKDIINKYESILPENDYETECNVATTGY